MELSLFTNIKYTVYITILKLCVKSFEKGKPPKKKEKNGIAQLYQFLSIDSFALCNPSFSPKSDGGCKYFGDCEKFFVLYLTKSFKICWIITEPPFLMRIATTEQHFKNLLIRQEV